MKKLLVLTLALVLTLSAGYVTLAGTMGIGATEGAFSVEIGKWVAPSGSDAIDITGFYGVNDQTLVWLGYTTEAEAIRLGARYAFSENMAATFDYVTADEEEVGAAASSTEIMLGLRYKTALNDTLALAGALSYNSYTAELEIMGISDEETATGIELVGQAEYTFTEKAVGILGFCYTKPEEDDAYTTIITGIETYPTEQLCIYLDYYIPEEGDNAAYLGVSYSF